MTAPAPAGPRRRHRDTVPAWQLWAVGAISALSALAATFVDAEPTASAIADSVWLALLGAAVPLAASRARRWAIVVMTGVTALAAAGGAQLAAAGAALVVACALVVVDRRHRVVSAAVGAVAIQVLLRLPDLGFHGASAIVAAVAIAPVMVSGLRNTRRRWRRPILIGAGVVAGFSVVMGVAVVGAALLLEDDIDSGVDQARAGLDAATDGDDQAASELFNSAADDLDRASSQLSSPFLGLARAVPVVGQHQRALATGSTAARDLSLAAADAVDAVELSSLKPVDGQVDLDAVASIEAPLAASVASLEQTLDDLETATSPWLAPPLAEPLDQIHDEVSATLPGAQNALAGAQVVPGMLGADGPRTWLVLFTTPAETRLLGGFVGNWATIRAEDGRLALIDSGPSREINGGPGSETREIVEPEEFVVNYERYSPSENFQNASASPHFPSSAQVAADFYEQSMLEGVDGVIVVDPIALGSIADLVGGVEQLPLVGGPFDGDALTELLLVDIYELPDAEGELVLDAAIETTFAQLTSGSLPGPGALADALGPDVHDGRLLMWSRDDAEQDLLAQLGLAGELPVADGRDMLLVGVANNAPNKIDVYLDRDIHYAVEYDQEDGSVDAVATTTLTNSATTDLPPVVIGNAHGAPPGTARTYVTLFSPLGLSGLEVDGDAVAVEAHTEQGYRSYSALVEVPPGGSVTLTWRLSGELDPGGYDLRHHIQPLVRAPTFELDLTVEDP